MSIPFFKVKGKQKVKIANDHAKKSDKTQLINQFKPFFEALLHLECYAMKSGKRFKPF